MANALGIAHPAVVEKDFFAVQLLKLLQQITCLDYQLVFAGGTCLAKAHCQTYRMSEDIDIKLIPNDNTLAMTKGQQRSSRKKLFQTLNALLETTEPFKFVSAPVIRNEYKYQQFLLSYPTRFAKIDALRPHLQLEFTQSICLQAIKSASIASMYAEVAQIGAELDSCKCVGLESIAAEKLVSLLRRTAAVMRNPTHEDDPTLIRHLYDLHLIFESGLDESLFAELVQRVIQIDATQFGNQQHEFRQNPIAELKFALRHIQTEDHYKERYRDFIGPLVYHTAPVSWEQALNTFVLACGCLG